MLPEMARGVARGVGSHVCACIKSIAKINNGGLKQSDANSDENKSKAGGFGTVRSGFLQGSNIDITEEIADQIVSKAAFKANGNFSKANDEILGTILDIKY